MPATASTNMRRHSGRMIVLEDFDVCERLHRVAHRNAKTSVDHRLTSGQRRAEVRSGRCSWLSLLAGIAALERRRRSDSDWRCTDTVDHSRPRTRGFFEGRCPQYLPSRDRRSPSWRSNRALRSVTSRALMTMPATAGSSSRFVASPSSQRHVPSSWRTRTRELHGPPRNVPAGRRVSRRLSTSSSWTSASCLGSHKSTRARIPAPCTRWTRIRHRAGHVDDEHQVRGALHERSEPALTTLGQGRRLFPLDQCRTQRPVREHDSDPHQDRQSVDLGNGHQRGDPTERDQSPHQPPNTTRSIPGPRAPKTSPSPPSVLDRRAPSRCASAGPQPVA